MKTKQFKCRHCRRMHVVQVKGQKYCSDKLCQRARQRKWRREKRESDPDYRANQRASNEKWLNSRGGSGAYFREYRKRRREAAEARQAELIQSTQSKGLFPRERSPKGLETKQFRKSAKSDASPGENIIKTGRYTLISESAKSDAILVDIVLISTG